MHIIKIKTKVKDLLLGQVRPGVEKLRPVAIFRAARKSLKQIIKKIINHFCLQPNSRPFF